MKESYWNYRTIYIMNCDTYLVGEVYYENDEPVAWCQAYGSGESLNELEKDFCDHILALRQPVLYWDEKKLHKELPGIKELEKLIGELHRKGL